MSWIETLLGCINRSKKHAPEKKGSRKKGETLTKNAFVAYNKISLMVEIKLNNVIMRV